VNHEIIGKNKVKKKTHRHTETQTHTHTHTHTHKQVTFTLPSFLSSIFSSLSITSLVVLATHPSRLLFFSFATFIGYFMYLHSKCYHFPLPAPSASMMMLSLSPTHSHLNALSFTYTGETSLYIRSRTWHIQIFLM